MPALPRHPLQPKKHSVVSKVHRHPFFMFGLPFVATIVGASFALTTFTQTRYDLRDQQVTSMAQEEQLKMAKDRRKVDLREEYYRLSAGGSGGGLGGQAGEDDWENKYVLHSSSRILADDTHYGWVLQTSTEVAGTG